MSRGFLSWPRLLLHRARSTPGATATLAGVLAVVSWLAGTLLAVAVTGPVAWARQSLERAAPDQRAVQVSVRWDAAAPAAQDARVRGHLAGALAGTGPAVRTRLTGEPLTVAGTAGGTAGGTVGGTRARLLPVVVDGAAGGAAGVRLVSGRWPGPAAGGAVPAALPQDVARRLRVRPGDVVRLESPAGAERSPALQVVGVWAVPDAMDPAVTSELLPGIGTPAGLIGSVLVERASAGALPVTWTARWRADPDPTRLHPAELPRLVAGLAGLGERLADVPTAGGAAASVDGGLGAFLLTQRDTWRQVRASAWLLLALLAGLALLAVVVAGGLLAQLRRGEGVLLAVRGARSREQLALAGLEAGALGALVAVPVTAAVALGTRALLGVPAGRPVLLAVAAGTVLAGAGLGALAALLQIRRRRWLDRGAAGTDRAPARLAAVGGGVLLAVALAGWQLRQFADRGAPAPRGGLDLVLLAAPVVLLGGAGVLLLAGQRWLHRSLALAGRGRRAVPALLGWHAARQPARPVPVALGLVVGVAAACCLLVAASTLVEVVRTRAARALGADLAVTVPSPAGTQAFVAQARVAAASATLRGVPGVRAASPVLRLDASVADTPVRVVGLDAAAAARLTAPAADAAVSPSAVRALTDRPAAGPGGVALPGVRRIELGVRAGFQVADVTGGVPEDQVTRPPPPLRVTAVLAGPGAAAPVRLPLGRLPLDASSRSLDADLPPSPAGGSWSLVGLDVTAAPAAGADVTVDLEVSAIRQGPAGGANPVRAPRTWQVRDAGSPGAGRGGATLTPPFLGGLVRLEVLLPPRAPATTVQLAIDPPQRAPVPALVDARLARLADLRAGAGVSVSQSGVAVPLVVSAVVPRLPGVTSSDLTEAGGPPAALVDRAALVASIRAAGDPVPLAREWWLTGPVPPDRVRAALAAAGIGDGQVLDAPSLVDRRLADPWLAGLAGLLDLAVLPMLSVAAAILALGAAAGARRRRAELAALRALGASRRQVRTLVLAGHAVDAGSAAVAGLLAGVLAAPLMVPLLISPVSAGEVPALDLPWLWLGALLAGALATVAGTAALAASAATRADVPAVLRESQDVAGEPP